MVRITKDALVNVGMVSHVMVIKLVFMLCISQLQQLEQITDIRSHKSIYNDLLFCALKSTNPGLKSVLFNF